jgi:hypothetical protein
MSKITDLRNLDDLLDLGISDGTNGQVLTTNGSGTFTFVSIGQFSSSNTSNGYVKLPNDIIFQWGFKNITSQTGSVTFPTSFPNNCWIVNLTSDYNGSKFASTVTSKATTSFNYRVGDNWHSDNDFYWFAIGN